MKFQPVVFMLFSGLIEATESSLFKEDFSKSETHDRVIVEIWFCC